MTKTKVSILGINGYTGYELLKILLVHPHIELAHLAVRQIPSPYISDLFPKLKSVCDMQCSPLDASLIAPETDLLFSALPHKVSMTILPKFIKINPDLKIIDLSADYRYDSVENYQNAYEIEHMDPSSLNNYVYGLPEHHREKIQRSNYIANPGCFPTGIQIALLAALKNGLIDTQNIFIDSKTGVSGGGRTPKDAFHYPNINENMHAYKVGLHQHEPEIEQELSKMAGKNIDVVFVPHLIPVTRGILNTIYCTLNTDISEKEIFSLYAKQYDREPFVRILEKNETPQIAHVNHSNFCDVGIKKIGKSLVLMSAIDNLIKGAAGQAIQNMNLMLGYDETQALIVENL